MEIKKPIKSKGIPKQKNRSDLYDSIEETFETQFRKNFFSQLFTAVKKSSSFKL